MHLKVHNNCVRRSVFWNCTCLCLFLYCFIPMRTPLELQNLLSFCYFSIFKIPSWGYGLSAGSVYRGTFTMWVMKIKSRARCAGFELDLRTKNSRSPKFFSWIVEAKGGTEPWCGYLFGRDLATGDIWPQNHLNLLCHFTGVVINLHWLAGN